MRLLLNFYQEYPLQVGIMVGAMLLGTIAEGFGISVFIPMLNLIINHQTVSAGTAAAKGTGLEAQMEALLGGVLKEFGLSSTVAGLLVIFILCIVVKCLLVLFANRQIGYTVANITTDLRLNLLRAMFLTRWEYFLRQPAGQLTNAIATEAQRSSKAFSAGAKLISVVIEVVVYATVALLVSWKATLLALTVGAFIFFILKRYIGKARQAGEKQTRLLQSILALMTDSLHSIKPLKAMGREGTADAVLQKKTTRLNRALQKQVVSTTALGALQEPMMMVFLAGMLYVALILLNMSLTAIMAIVYLIRRVLKNLQKIQSEYQRIAISESAYWSLRKKIEEAKQEKEPHLGRKTPDLTQSIRLQNVSFAYDHKPILGNVSLDLPEGTFVALAGSSGAGKTTIADLIIGLLRPQQGEIWIDDLPMADVDLKQWRRMIGYVPQETMLLHDTVLINVTLGEKQIDDREVEASLRAAGAWDFVSRLPQGMHTVVGEGGSKISGGQRQRIAIARALLHKPKLLVLDEATTALDPETEAAICRTLRKLQGEVTILAISHQKALLEAAQIAYRIEGGSAKLVKEDVSGDKTADGGADESTDDDSGWLAASA